MARKRMIDPNFWIDEKLGTCDPMARLTFMGLISQSDDEGRLGGHTALLKSVIFPYDNISIEKMDGFLKELEAKNLIKRYEVDGQKYIELPNFHKHQTINKKTESKLPPSPIKEDYGSTTTELPPNIKEENIREEKGKEDNNDQTSDEVSLLKKELGIPETPTKGIYTEFQAEAVRIAKALGAPNERISAYMKVVKEEKRSLILSAYSFAVDYEPASARDKMFFFQLNKLKREVSGVPVN